MQLVHKRASVSHPQSWPKLIFVVAASYACYHYRYCYYHHYHHHQNKAGWEKGGVGSRHGAVHGLTSSAEWSDLYSRGRVNNKMVALELIFVFECMGV